MKDIFMIPNLVTCLRLLLIIPALLLLASHSWISASLTIGILFLTDFFDGYLARKWNQTSDLGALLDPIVDKLAVISFILFLYWNGIAPGWYVLLVCVRDLAQLSVVPVLIIWKKIPFQVKPKLIPKWGTAFNFNLLTFYFLFYIERTTLTEFLRPFYFVEAPLLMISAFIELYVLITFIPRYIRIYQRTHDTFE